MKLTLTIPASALLLGAFTALPAADQPAAPAAPAAAVVAAPAAPAKVYTEDQILETLGWLVGSRLADFELTPEQTASVIKGVTLAASGKEVPFKEEEIGEQFTAYMQAKQAKAQEKQAAAAKVKAAAGQAAADKFLAETKAKAGVVALPDGLLYEIIQPGKGDFPKPTDTVKVNYTGTLISGTKFDSSADHGEPATFPLNQVIPGWTEGIQKINKGGKIKLYIPPALGYGDQGVGDGLIPPGSALVFEVELLDINPPTAAPVSATTPPVTAPETK